MSDFKFNCPHCEQSLEAPEEMLGQTIECPSCNGSIELPKPEPQLEPEPTPEPTPPPEPEPEPAPPPKPEMQDCPYCGEEILAKAKKCKHCGEFLDGRSSAPKPQSSRKKSNVLTENELWRGHPSFLYYLGHFIFGIPLLLLFGIGLIPILYAILDRNTKTFTLTNKRVATRAGIISRHTHEVSIRDVRNLNVKQGIIERLFGLGTIEIGSAGTAGIEIKFAGVKNPTTVRDKIRNQKDEADG